MRIVFYSYGTRGDAQPQVVLATALRERGYQVRVAAPENLRGFVEASGVEYAPLFGSSQEILESEVGRRWLSSGNVRAFMAEMGKITQRIGEGVNRTGAEAARDADVIVGGTLIEDLTYSLAEERKIPFFVLRTFPMERTGDFPAPLVTQARVPFAFLNRWSYALQRKLTWGVFRETVNQYRATAGLTPLKNTVIGAAHEHGMPTLQAWSEHVLPHTTDAAPSAQTTGYLRMPASVRTNLGESAPPSGLVEWLEKGPPPIYLGFGSMPVLDPAAMARHALEAAAQLNQRVVLLAGWTNLSEVQHLGGDRAFFLQHVDHSWLLPRCVAAVHHGGAGTTAESLAAGVPTLICSVFADQPFWGATVTRLGVGAHVPFAKLNERTLTAGLRAVLKDDVRQRAADLGARIRAEEGTAKTVEAIVRHIGPPKAKVAAVA